MFYSSELLCAKGALGQIWVRRRDATMRRDEATRRDEAATMMAMDMDMVDARLG